MSVASNIICQYHPRGGLIMRGLSKKARIGLIERDVILTRRHAKMVLTVKEKTVKIEKNAAGRLGVIAVIGPGSSDELRNSFNEAVLLEVGIGKSRPYHEARGLNRKSGESNIPKRLKECWLTKEQYIVVAPFIFKTILELAKDKVEGWRSSHHSFWTPDRRYSKKKKKFHCYWNFCDWPRGMRFSVSCLDSLILADVLFAERHVNRYISSKIGRHARLISLVFSDLYDRKISSVHPDLVCDLKEGMEKVPSHIRRYILDQVPERVREYWADDLAQIFKVPINGKHQEADLIESLKFTGGSRSCINNMQLRVTTGIDAGKDHVTFEVFPYTENIYVNPKWLAELERQREEIDNALELNQYSDCPF